VAGRRGGEGGPGPAGVHPGDVAIGHPESICPKSWRHTFATLLQDANVDPLIRQQVMGHKPTTGSGLGMTANYTHTRSETCQEQVERALRRWPGPLEYAVQWAEAVWANRPVSLCLPIAFEKSVRPARAGVGPDQGRTIGEV
jgi:hypothetical protein